MSRIIAITNQKGGVGKTTTAHALGTGLVRKGHRVLFVDLDPQCNLSFALASKPGASSYELLTHTVPAAEIIQQTDQGYHVIPSSSALAAADMQITSTGKEYRLREALWPVDSLYDFILIDTPPALGTLTVNALTAAHSLIIPAQAEIFSLQGIGELSGTIHAVKTYCNPGLKLEGVLLTRHSVRAILSRDMADLIRDTAQQLGTVVFDTIIREGIAVKEAQANQQSLFDYAPRSKPAADYIAFVDEYLERSHRT